MCKTIVNLTLPVVSKEVEQVLDTYPYCLYKPAFDMADLRLELVAYVLNRISNLYVVTDEGPHSPISLRPCSSERLQIDTLIRQGIHVILQKLLAVPPEEFSETLRLDESRECV